MSTSLIPAVVFEINLEKKSNLMIACERVNIEIVKTLIEDKNMNFALEDQRKKNALYYAIDNKNKEKGGKYVEMILEKSPNLVTNA